MNTFQTKLKKKLFKVKKKYPIKLIISNILLYHTRQFFSFLETCLQEINTDLFTRLMLDF